MWRQAADVSKRVDFDPQQFQAGVAGRELKGDTRQTQETGGIGSTDETVDKGRLDLVEVWLRRWRARRPVRLVRRLPLHRCALGVRMIVSRPIDMVVMMIVRVIMPMFVTVLMVMMTVMVMTHGGPQ